MALRASYVMGFDKAPFDRSHHSNVLAPAWRAWSAVTATGFRYYSRFNKDGACGSGAHRCPLVNYC